MFCLILNRWQKAFTELRSSFIQLGIFAGFIIIGKNIVHIDAGMTTKDGEWLLSQSMKIAAVKNPQQWLILTHHHSDHIFGMRPFKEAGARIVAHEDLRKFLSKRMPPLFKTGITRGHMKVTLTITGSFKNGTQFEGSDTIELIITKPRGCRGFAH